MLPLLKYCYESLNTEQGHMATCFMLLLIGYTAAIFQLPKAEDIIVGSFGALLATLRGSGSMTKQ